METKQLERIRTMEEIFNQSAFAVEHLQAALEEYKKVLPKLKLLIEYYESVEWRMDYDADSAGAFPSDLPRGVLSQDAVFDLLGDIRQIEETMETLIRISYK